MGSAGFTFIESIVAITLVGIGVASTVAALTKINSFAGTARNSTGAYAAVMNQIDLILSDGPFNPQKTNEDGTPQIPPELKLTVGPPIPKTVPIYKEDATNTIVWGTMTTTVTDVSATYNGYKLPMYQATVRVEYTYLNRKYSFSMSTIRASDI